MKARLIHYAVSVWHLYYDGFRSMTVGRTLWAVILIKLFIIFAVLKLFFFPNYIHEHAMTNLLLDISTGTVDWARAQFALTAIYHWLFVPLTLGLALIMGIVETCYYRTGKAFWKETARFWQRLFGVNFAMGVATGIILEFEFGTNWSNYSWMVGDIFGAPLAIEGIVAFFMESTFVAVMFFGWNKVSRGFHLASTWLTGLGATISAWWILVANAWMQYPIGQEFNPDTMRFEMTSFADVALSPFAVDKFCHTVTTSWIIGAAFTVAVSAYMVAQTQPMKLAAMEGLYNGGTHQGLSVVALPGPFSQPDYENDVEPPYRIAVPNMLSILATHHADGYVPGVNDLLGGFTRPDGSKEPSAREKMTRGRRAIANLAQYRQLMTAAKTGKGDTAAAKAQAQKILPQLKADMPYFGYGYIKDVHRLVPNIPISFFAFRTMVGIGCLFILFFLVVLHYIYRLDITKPRWLLIAAIVMLPLAYIGSEAGWVVAEVGRQPWTIQDMLPVGAAVSGVSSGSIATTFFVFLFLFTTMLAVEVSILCKQIKNYNFE